VADELTGGRADPRSRPRVPAALLLAVLLGAAGHGAVRWESARQYDALLAAAAHAEQVVVDSRRSLGGLVQYSSGLLARTDLQPAQRRAVLASFAVDARRFPPRVEQARAQAAAVRPLPWDGELAQARDAYLTRLDAWTGFVAAAQDQPDTLLLERRATRQARLDAARTLDAAADGRSSHRLDLVRDALLGR
jgi:hypothetical protein